MYKVLIVDDEMIVRVGLKSFIDWESYGFTLCGEANNGEEALVLCGQLQPDVVLTDIKMPKLDGVGFIEQAMKRWPNLKVIVLSCVNEFDVLQQVLRFGVKDYFLKLSFDPEHLTGMLDRIRQELELQKPVQPQLAHETPQPELAVLKENFYRIAVRDKHNALKADPRVKLLIGKGDHVIMYIGGDHPYNPYKDDPKLRGHLLKYSVINILEEVVGREVPSDVVELEEDGYLVVCSVNGDWNDDTALLLAREVQQSLLRFLNYSVSIGISRKMNCFGSFYTCYSQSVSSLKQKFYEGHGAIRFYSEEVSAWPRKSLQNLLSPAEEYALNQQLESFAFEDVRFQVLGFLEQLASDQNWNPADIKPVVIELLLPWLQLYKKYGGTMKDMSGPSGSPYDFIHSLETLQDIKLWYQDYTIRLEEQIRRLSKGKRSREEIEKAKRFVEKNYAKDISVVDVARHIGLNSTYFSHLFKKENGKGFAEFLTHFRLTQAQRLLRESPQNINEIAEEVGYNDVAYFRKMFRQQLHMTPTEYRAQFSKHQDVLSGS